MKPIVDIERFYDDGDGYVLAGAVCQVLQEAGQKELIGPYLTELQSLAWSYEHCLQISKKYCILKNLEKDRLSD